MRLFGMVVSIFIFASALSMQPENDFWMRLRQVFLRTAIQKGNVEQVRAALKNGASATFRTTEGTPLEFAYRADIPEAKKEAILDVLLQKGALKSDLNQFLYTEAAVGNFNKVDWLVKHGAYDSGGIGLEKARKKIADESNTEKKQNYSRIIELLEQKVREGQAKTRAMWEHR